MTMCMTSVFAASKTYKNRNVYKHYEITKKGKKKIKKLKFHSYNKNGKCKKCGYRIPDYRVRITLSGTVGRQYSKSFIKKLQNNVSKKAVGIQLDDDVLNIIKDDFGSCYKNFKKCFHLEIYSCNVKKGKFEMQGLLARHFFQNGKCYFCGQKG